MESGRYGIRELRIASGEKLIIQPEPTTIEWIREFSSCPNATFISPEKTTVYFDDAYSILAKTDKKCTCSACQNFWQVGQAIFPPDVIKLFDLLGVDWRFPGEIYHNCQLSPGKHNYGGWYHFVGSFKGEESNERIPTKMKRFEFTPWPKLTTIESYNIRLKSVNEDLQIGFSNRLSIVSSAFKGLDIIQCDFNVNNVPWELAEEEPT